MKFYYNDNNQTNIDLNENRNPNNIKKTLLIAIIAAVIASLLPIVSAGIILFKSFENISSPNDIISQIPFVSNNTNVETVPDSIIDPNGQYLSLENIPDNQIELPAKQIFEENSNSVIYISIYEIIDSKPKLLGEGSGVVISENGYIITNSHVIEDSKKYEVKVSTATDTYVANVVGFDTRTDLAVLKINASNLNYAKFANSDQLSVGSNVLAIGNPEGKIFSNSLTQGIVSAVGRSLDGLNTSNKYIQTTAAINPGNSGGALFNMYGQVIGITSAKIVDASIEGLCFAIPSTTVKKISDDLIQVGYVRDRVKLGITGKIISEYTSENWNIPQGIMISQISETSGLNNKGVSNNDIITHINDQEITSFGDLFSELDKYKKDDTVTLKVFNFKDKTSQDINVPLLEHIEN